MSYVTRKNKYLIIESTIKIMVQPVMTYETESNADAAVTLQMVRLGEMSEF